MSRALVMVGVDESATAQCALEWAITVGELHRADVEVVQAWQWHHPTFDLLVPGAPATLGASVLLAVEAQVEKALEKRPSGASAVRVTARAVEGDAPVALMTEAAHADLLVLGRHGRSAGLRGLVEPDVGSLTGYCLRHSAVPVAVVPPATAATAAARVVVGVDGSASSAQALRWAVSEARVLGVPVVAVLAWQMASVSPPEHARAAGPVPPLSEWEAVARGVLEATVDLALDPDEAREVVQVLLHRRPTDGLLDTVRTNDLLVLGRRGRGGFDRLLLGSVSQQCAAHAPCPVVVVPERVRSLTPPGAA